MPARLTPELSVIQDRGRPDDVELLGTVLAVDGILVTAWDRDDMAAVGECVERLRVLLTIWHAARDGEREW